MKITDCYWERKNLNKKAVEIIIESEDAFSSNVMEKVTSGYEYIVVKVPINKPDYNFSLSTMGFTMVEMQLNISKTLKEFDYKASLLRIINKHICFEVVSSKADFDEIISQITRDMFSTDRIALDPLFGPDFAYKRYINWLRIEYEQSYSNILKIIYKNEVIGFVMFRIEDEKVYVKLGGIFKKYQNYGLGILTTCSLFLYSKQNSVPFKRLVTSVSSNNMPVIEFYNYLNYKIDSMTYVYVKHT